MRNQVSPPSALAPIVTLSVPFAEFIELSFREQLNEALSLYLFLNFTYHSYFLTLSL